MAVKHLQSTDKRHSFNTGSITVKKCIRCDSEFSTYGGTDVSCPSCGIGFTNSLKTHRVIQSKKVDDIKNRYVERDETYTNPEAPKGSIEELWDKGLIRQKIRATVKPISGTGKLEIIGRKNKISWLDKVVEINGGYYRLSDLGAALKEIL